MYDIISYNMKGMEQLPPPPGVETLARLRRSEGYQCVLEALEPRPRPAELAQALEAAALYGNAPGVLALLEAGVPATADALEAALRSVHPTGLASARLLFDAGARLHRLH